MLFFFAHNNKVYCSFGRGHHTDTPTPAPVYDEVMLERGRDLLACIEELMDLQAAKDKAEVFEFLSIEELWDAGIPTPKELVCVIPERGQFLIQRTVATERPGGMTPIFCTLDG